MRAADNEGERGRLYQHLIGIKTKKGGCETDT